MKIPDMVHILRCRGFLPVLVFIVVFAAAAEFPRNTVRAEGLSPYVGSRGALLVVDSRKQRIFEINADKRLVPASILKIFTSLFALHRLGPEYRFCTDVYLDKNNNLKIKGYGDPLLISEIVAELAGQVANRLSPVRSLNHLILDATYFQQPLSIPGISSSANPYDAPNGALCVNFNTVDYRLMGAEIVSAEPQTPMLSMAKEKIRRSQSKQGRIVLSHNENEVTLYAGNLFRYFFEQNGLSFKGRVRLGRVSPASDTRVLRYRSPFRLKQIIARLLEHSNNFMANQLLIAAGADASGPPGNLAHGVKAAQRFARQQLHITDLAIAEGSGISRKNQISANQMDVVLQRFHPYQQLMQRNGNQYFKTGTLYGISARAGYIQKSPDRFYRFVIMLNTPGKSAASVMKKLLPMLD